MRWSEQPAFRAALTEWVLYVAWMFSQWKGLFSALDFCNKASEKYLYTLKKKLLSKSCRHLLITIQLMTVLGVECCTVIIYIFWKTYCGNRRGAHYTCIMHWSYAYILEKETFSTTSVPFKLQAGNSDLEGSTFSSLVISLLCHTN